VAEILLLDSTTTIYFSKMMQDSDISQVWSQHFGSISAVATAAFLQRAGAMFYKPNLSNEDKMDLTAFVGTRFQAETYFEQPNSFCVGRYY